jgi:arylsulfatase A-like enzyme
MAACVLGAAVALAESSEAMRKKPNFVVIFVDDMGCADIEPFGSKKNKTPRLNRMADEGLKLTSFYAAPVCSPSRAALMTGCYPKRVGLATGSWAGVLFPKDPHGLNPKEKTVAEVLKDAGYTTGCFGKWHLGDQPEFLPTNQGFDTYFGIPYSNDMWPPMPAAKKWKSGACPLPVLRGTKVVDIVKGMDDQAQLCKRFTDEAIGFIRKNKDRPFFLYFPHSSIHGPRQARKEFMDRANGDSKRAQVEELDWSIGLLLDTIQELGLADNTLVFFTSDNGGTGDSNIPLRGGKGSTWEGGMREPTIAWWPGTIPANSVSDEIASTMDLLPTLATLGGAKVPDDRVIDGKDITPILRDPKYAKSPYKAFYYYGQDNLQAVRSGPWKLHVKGQLYNLEKDIGEENDVAGENPEIVARLRKYLDECRADLDDPKNCRPVGLNEDPQYLVPLSAGEDKSQESKAFHQKDLPVFVNGRGAICRLPSLLVTRDGTVLAACQKRKGGDDWSESALVLRRSRDGGRTWSDEQTLFDRDGWCCFNGNLVEDRRNGELLALFIAFPKAAGPNWFRSEWIPAGGGFDLVRSTNGGSTWSQPEHHMPAPNPDGWRGGAAFNNNHGVQISTGPHTGRLVVGGRVFKTGAYQGRAKGGVIYSDDGGKTWRVGGVGLSKQAGVNGEVTLCEASGGQIYVNYRREGDPLRQRLFSRSRDGGASFYEEGSEENLPAHGCNAGLASFTPRGAEKPLLLFSYPLKGKGRSDLMCYLSRDDGRSWASTRVISASGGYSDVSVLPDATILTLYPKKDGNRHEKIFPWNRMGWSCGGNSGRWPGHCRAAGV